MRKFSRDDGHIPLLLPSKKIRVGLLLAAAVQGYTVHVEVDRQTRCLIPGDLSLGVASGGMYAPGCCSFA
jgi:hypothetical protein